MRRGSRLRRARRRAPTVGDRFLPGAGWSPTATALRRHRFADRHLPAHLATGAQARRRGDHGADRRRRCPGRSATGSASRSTSSRSSSIRCSRGPTWRKPPRDRPRRGGDRHAAPDRRRDRAPRAAGPPALGYLQSHAARFSRTEVVDLPAASRRSRMFGIGPVQLRSVQGGRLRPAQRPPRFRASGPVEGRPVMLDDTCYFLPCRRPSEAAVLTALCNDPITLDVIRSLSFARRQAADHQGTVAADRPLGHPGAGGSRRAVGPGRDGAARGLGLDPADRAPVAGEIERLQYLLNPAGPNLRPDPDDRSDEPPRRR